MAFAPKAIIQGLLAIGFLGIYYFWRWELLLFLGTSGVVATIFAAARILEKNNLARIIIYTVVGIIATHLVGRLAG